MMADQTLNILVVQEDLHDQSVVHLLKGLDSPSCNWSVADTVQSMAHQLEQAKFRLILLDLKEGYLEAMDYIRRNAPESAVMVIFDQWDEAKAEPMIKAGAQEIFLRGTSDFSRLLKTAVCRKEAEKDAAGKILEEDSFYDALTGLPTRPLFMSRLHYAIKRHKRYPFETFAVFFLDIDHFKMVNDALGKNIADQLILNVARRLSLCFREVDTLSRLGGDKFLVLLDSPIESAGCNVVADRIKSVLDPPFDIQGNEVFVSVSIGIALVTSEYTQEEDALRDAETALMHAKKKGGNQYQIFDSKMHSEALSRLNLERDLRRAIEQKEFSLVYQPVISLATGQLSGFEALLRWPHPSKGLIFPLEFIALAEDTGLIIPLGRWVLEEACAQMSDWQKKSKPHSALQLHVNASFKQLFQKDFMGDICRITEQSDLKTGTLCLEIAESGIMSNPETFLPILNKLQGMKIEIHLDDFGSGSSSLIHLHRFHFNRIKISQSFLSQSPQSEILPALINLTHSLGVASATVGIETMQKMEELKRLGCRYGQGFLFSKPLAAKDVEIYLKQNR